MCTDDIFLQFYLCVCVCVCVCACLCMCACVCVCTCVCVFVYLVYPRLLPEREGVLAVKRRRLSLLSPCCSLLHLRQPHLPTPQKSPTFSQKSPTFSQKRLVFYQKSPLFYQNRLQSAALAHTCGIQKTNPVFYQKSPAFHEKSRVFYQKSPIFYQTSPYASEQTTPVDPTKEPYIGSKEPYFP